LFVRIAHLACYLLPAKLDFASREVEYFASFA
jgi:hypothetical protein